MELRIPAPSAPDSGLYAEGTRAINQGRWADAVKLFTQAASLKSDHADGALYWKAYSLNKLGRRDQALPRKAPALARTFSSLAISFVRRSRSAATSIVAS